MIIIKIIILYFIQIRHTDDFPSTGTRLVFIIDLEGPVVQQSHDIDAFETVASSE